MDVGAYDGMKLNNTLFFEQQRKWTGINIEANPHVFDKLVKNRPKSVNINCAVSNSDGEAEFILNKGYTEMLCGLKNQYDPRHKSRLESEIAKMGGSTEVVKVKTRKIESICREYDIGCVNYLSIDVEGAEFEVVKSIDFNKLYIDVIGFENNYEDSSREVVKYLESKDYIFLAKSLDIFMIHKDSKFKTF